MTDPTPATAAPMRNQDELRADTEMDMILTTMSGGQPSDAILRAEAMGQRELVRSERLPVKGSESPAVVALGIEWGDPTPGDPIFREARLPEGWGKQPTDHSMWSEITRADGEVVASMFYKAAFYDRDAFIRAERWCGCGHNQKRHPYDEAAYPVSRCSVCECPDFAADPEARP